ncbi:hypothetical protein RIF29_34165 [Crotalaria pallida]|uniref:Uncharacterized protein n=1 Tax=Crotalaria pallida TaxID=3830 RepID=A0AAN9E8Y6_CROPI
MITAQSQDICLQSEQALTALLASQGTLGLTNLLGMGSLGSTTAVNPAIPTVGQGIQGSYSAQPTVTPGVIELGGFGRELPLPHHGGGGGGDGVVGSERK